MRILFLTNFYPPHELGGEERSCQQVVEGLKQRGHATLVLTSMHGTNNVPVESDGISRLLYLEMDIKPWLHSIKFFTEREKREKHNLLCLERLLEVYKPDIVFIWGIWNLARSLPHLAEAKCPGKVVYRFASYWPTLPSQNHFYWQAPGRKWYSWLPKKALGALAGALMDRENQRQPLKFEHAICVSAATRDILVEKGIPVSRARIIHTGIDVTSYLNNNHRRLNNENLNLEMLYAGRLTAEKGVTTLFRAMAKLVKDRSLRNVRLRLAGSGLEAYEEHLRFLVAQTGLKDFVEFLGRVPFDQIPDLMRKFDVLLVPSTWQEPFSRVVLEGMISGLVVVATATGGTGEILIDGDNGLLFSPGNADELAEKIAVLAADPELRQKLAHAGYQTVSKRFTSNRMLDEIEKYLDEVTII